MPENTSTSCWAAWCGAAAFASIIVLTSFLVADHYYATPHKPTYQVYLLAAADATSFTRVAFDVDYAETCDLFFVVDAPTELLIHQTVAGYPFPILRLTATAATRLRLRPISRDTMYFSLNATAALLSPVVATCLLT